MQITEEGLQHWMNHFYGYGHWQARYWFIGYEESGGDLPEELAEKLGYFSRVHGAAAEPTLCHVRNLYRDIVFRTEGPRAERYPDFFEHRFGAAPVQHGFWKNLIAFEHGCENQPLPDPIAYQQHRLAAPDGTEALLVLYPLPAHSHAWYYSWLPLPHLPYLRTRAQYEQHVYAPRMATLLQQMAQHRPHVVLMYGMNNINDLKQSVQAAFPGTVFKSYKAVPHQLPAYHRAEVAGTTLLLTTQIPGLHHNRKDTGFDWYAFGQKIRAEK